MPKADEAVDLASIMAYIRELDQTYKLIEVAFDPRLFELPAQMLADTGVPMVEFPQSVERMTPAIGSLYEAIKRMEISHDGNAQYARQILNAIPRHNERGFMLSKGKSRGKIDAAIALSMMLDRAQHPLKEDPPLMIAWA
jgi:phage terminase large subunit-like protein